MPYLSSFGSERDLLAAILVTKSTCREKLKEVTLIFSKYLSTLLPIILSGDRLQNARARKERESTKVKLLKSTRESMRVQELEANDNESFNFRRF